MITPETMYNAKNESATSGSEKCPEEPKPDGFQGSAGIRVMVRRKERS